jgi:NAD kinase
MANKREFKKDVNFLTNEILMRGMVHLEFFGQSNSEEVFKIINEAVIARNNYITRINERINDKSAKEVKSHFKSIYDDLLQSTHGLLERIDNLDLPV